MHASLESEKLHRIDYVLHPLLGVDIAVVFVAAAVGGGRIVAVACQSVEVSLGGFVCHAIVWIGAACGGVWEVARGFLFQIDVTAIVIVTPLRLSPDLFTFTLIFGSYYM